MRVYEIVHDDDAGYWMLLEDGIGLAKSKSRNVIIRIRDAFTELYSYGLCGLTVESSIWRDKRGVVVAIDGDSLIVRQSDQMLARWEIYYCKVVDPERPTKETPIDDPPISVRTACSLLGHWLEVAGVPVDALTEVAQLTSDTHKFLEACAKAESVL